MEDSAKAVTIVLPYYENPHMLERQLNQLASYDAETRQWLRLIVVDDGSPRQPARIGSCAVAFELYRCLVDVPWNWIFCRNLAASRATTDWMVMTDIDHLIPARTARALVRDSHHPQCGYAFSRVSAPDMQPRHPHANSWFLTKALFDEVGGYDERLSGSYGTDFDFRRRLQSSARVCLLANEIIRVPRSVVEDASTTTYQRISQCGKIHHVLRERGHGRPIRLTFPYERVQ